MQLIELKLDGKLLHYYRGSRQTFDVVANNDDYCVKVYFGDERPNAVGVIFEMFGTPYTVLLDENNVAEVPDGVLIGGKKLRVGLSWGEDFDAENLTGTMTSTDLEILVRYSIRSRLRDTPLATPSNSDFLTQLTTLVNSIKNVASVAIDTNGHLILTLTNGTTQDAGPTADWNHLANRPFGDLVVTPDPIEIPEDVSGLSKIEYPAKINGNDVTVTLYRVADYISPEDMDGATLYYSINGTDNTLTVDKDEMQYRYDSFKSIWLDDEEDGGANNWPGYRLVLINYTSIYGMLTFYDSRNDGHVVQLSSKPAGVYFASYSSGNEVVRVTKLQLPSHTVFVQIPDRYIPSTAQVSTAQAAAQTAQQAATSANTAKTNAETARTQAQTAKTAAEAAQTAAETAQTAAEAAQAAAETAAAESGKSAYEIAVDGGYSGTEQQWLASLVGPQGKSAYQLAVDGGYSGTEQQWLASLHGADGEDGDDYVLTSSDKETIATMVLSELPTAEGESYPRLNSAEGVSF